MGIFWVGIFSGGNFPRTVLSQQLGVYHHGNKTIYFCLICNARACAVFLLCDFLFHCNTFFFFQLKIKITGSI